MIENMYGVVANFESPAKKTFTKFHSTYEEAKAEAERLCKKEKCEFLVLRVIARCRLDDIPVKWEE